MAKLYFILVVTIFLVIQAVTKVGARKYEQDDSYIEEDDNGKRRSLAIAGGSGPVNEDYGDTSDSEYLRRALRTLSIDVASLRRTVRELYRSDLAAIKKTVDRLAETLSMAAMQALTPRTQVPVTTQNSVASLLGLNNPGAIAASLLNQPGFGLTQANSGLGNYGAIAGGSSLRDELSQILDANLVQQNSGQYGQASTLQNQALGQLLSGYKDMNTGMTTGLTPASNIPAQLLLSRF